MSRPLRLEFSGAIYHITSRGDRREPIYRDDGDRNDHLEVLAQAADRFDAQLLAYCQMGNHYHLVLHTRQGNLSRLMRHVNGVYTQRFNRRHGLVGHLLQGRFKAILVDRDAYLLTLCRYVERNPVAAGLVPHPADWQWSSCRAHLGLAPTPAWLDSDGLHGYLLGYPVKTSADRKRATALYAELTQQDDLGDLWQQGLHNQVFLGDEDFVKRSLDRHAPGFQSVEVPKLQRQRPVSLQGLLSESKSRDQAVHAAYTQHGVTMTRLAQELGLSVSRVSRIVAKAEAERGARANSKT
jgi:REP element-mobilizing transposase RayT